ncbi:114aa long hypothetical protein [Pyrococcus horikoshii OT3]|uniref:Uncharacterized protein n=1 Tax=Pyrococcus horikoshii (strain ATCC 700860 / DSM 12428 / JCM 9974 / NBRC 100139 / OT-3) TaxID=70601 RepID=O58016_PYRHO|nr:114aa long hypothetical protein [Pyrococcus horikoshii OT3]
MAGVFEKTSIFLASTILNDSLSSGYKVATNGKSESSTNFLRASSPWIISFLLRIVHSIASILFLSIIISMMYCPLSSFPKILTYAPLIFGSLIFSLIKLRTSSPDRQTSFSIFG